MIPGVRIRSILACSALLLAPALSAESVIGHGPDQGWITQQIDGAGVQVLGRRTDPSCHPACPTYDHMVLIDRRVACSQDFVQEFGEGGLRGSLSSNGQLVAWLTNNPPRLWTAPTSTLQPTELMPSEPPTANITLLDLSSTAAWLVHVRNDSGGSIVRRELPSGATDVVAGPDVTMNHHAVTAGGTVYFLQKACCVNAYHVRRRAIPPAAIEIITNDDARDERHVAVTSDGTRFVYTSRHITTGVIDIFKGGSSSGPVTLNPNPAWDMTSLDLSDDGLWATFASNGDWTGQNADASEEVFRVSVTNGQLRQLTNRIQGLQQNWCVASQSINADGGQLAMTPENRQIVATLGTMTMQYTTVPLTAPLVDAPISGLAPPPFDVVTELEPGVVISPAPGCTVGGFPLTVTCHALVRNSTEGDRPLILMPEFVFTGPCGVVRPRPIEKFMPAGRESVVTFAAPVPPPPCGAPFVGTYRLHVVAGDSAQVDRATGTLPFAF